MKKSYFADFEKVVFWRKYNKIRLLDVFLNFNRYTNTTKHMNNNNPPSSFSTPTPPPKISYTIKPVSPTPRPIRLTLVIHTGKYCTSCYNFWIFSLFDTGEERYKKLYRGATTSIIQQVTVFQESLKKK